MKTSIKQGLAPKSLWAKDIDGNVLKTYRIGKLLVTENLKTEHYNDGTPIPILEDPEEWRKDTSGAMCYPDNYLANKEKYGALYNFHAVQTNKLAPTGFHVPTDEEWKQIEIAAGMSKEEADKGGCWRGNGIGNKLKELLEVKYSGYRAPSGGGFYGLGTHAIWWSSSVSGAGSWVRQLRTSYTSVCRNVVIRSHGFSVRCVRELTQREIDLFDNLTISDEKGNNTENPRRDERGRFVKQNKEEKMNTKKLLQGTAEPEKLSIKERVSIKLILLAVKILAPYLISDEIEEIKKML
ncbi:MAG: fibrobacter succinogenes major paralogous domain-containing protein [Oscillibacter sp.]|nr:fibrobacter succinogenes major paralogous domain-containing protein [Oscillibacter sp.]